MKCLCRGPEIRQSQDLDQSQAPVTTVELEGSAVSSRYRCSIYFHNQCDMIVLRAHETQGPYCIYLSQERI